MRRCDLLSACTRSGSPNGNVQISQRSVDGHWRRKDAPRTNLDRSTPPGSDSLQ